jgi:hypothetical protein
MRTLAILIALALPIFGQRHKAPDIDAEKPEGQLLKQIGEENDAAKKAALMEQFAQQYPKLEATTWVLEQLQTAYIKAGDPDKILAAGERLVAADPDDTEGALQTLKAAEAKKDPALIKKWSATTSASARKLAATPKPAEADQQENWKNTVDYAKQVDTYTEYALFAAALAPGNPKASIDLGEALLARNPQSEYAMKVREPLFRAYRQTNANDKAVATAEQVLAVDQSNENMLLAVADNYLQNKKDPAKVHAYCAKTVEVMSAKPKPDGYSDADWNGNKNLVIGLAHYMNGKEYYNEKKFAPADESLRKALPLVETRPELKAEVLYLLGDSNYNLEHIQDAANYFRACSALKSPFQPNATKSLAIIKSKYTGIK